MSYRNRLHLSVAAGELRFLRKQVLERVRRTRLLRSMPSRRDRR